VTDEGAVIVPESVEELRNAVRDLLKDEDARAQGLNGRASGLTGFVGLILSVAAAAGAVGGRGTPAGLHHWPRIVVGVSVATALLALVGAVFASVVKVLLPSPGVTISIGEVERYPFPEFISQDKVMIQGRLMWGFVDALKRERQRNESKARWLKLSYIVVCVGLGLVSLAGATAIVDRYVAGRPGRVPDLARRSSGAAYPRFTGQPLHATRARRDPSGSAR
jgi:hypothetical protein